MSRDHPSDVPAARIPLDPADARLVERLRDAFAPEPEDGAQRAAFEARLRERIENDEPLAAGSAGRWAPALAGLAVALVSAWLVLGGVGDADGPTPAPRSLQVAAAGRADQLAWEESLFFPAAAETGSDPEELPGDYQAIAVAFFGETL